MAALAVGAWAARAGRRFQLPGGQVLAIVAAAPLALAFARLLPASGPGLALRLAAATVCVLILPGALLAWAAGWPGTNALAVAASVAGSLTALFFALMLTFATGASLSLTLGVLAVVTLAALVAGLFLRLGDDRARRGEGRAERIAVGGLLVSSVAFSGLLWWVAREPGADALFHLARVRKLVEFHSLDSLGALSTFRDGGLDPGYAFPLWHGALAVVARLAGVDPTDAVVYTPAVLAPLAFLVAYAAGAALFGSWAGGIAVAAAQVAHLGFSRGGAGSFEALSLPATTTRLLLLPTVLALVFAVARGAPLRALLFLGGAGLAVTVVHPSYVVFLLIPLAGYVAAALVLARGGRELTARLAACLAAVGLPAGLFVLWLLPVVRSTASFSPSAEEDVRALAHYAPQLDVSGESFRLAPEAIARGGPVVVAALLAVPLAVFASRRAWAAFVLGGSLAVLAVLLLPAAFTTLSDLVSLSQTRRLGAFLPIAFAVAGAALLAGRLRLPGVAAAFAVGLALELAYSADLTYRLVRGGPTWPVWVAVAGGAAALVAGVFLRRDGPHAGAWAAAAALAFVAPMAVGGLASFDAYRTRDSSPLTPGLVQALRDLEPRSIVFADLGTAYRISAYAPLYVNAGPPGHIADTKKNRPYERRRDVLRFFGARGGTVVERRRLLAKYDAGWLVVEKSRRRPESLLASLELTYEDDRYALYHVLG